MRMRLTLPALFGTVLAPSLCSGPAAMAQGSISVEPMTPIAQFTDNVAVQIRNKLYRRGTDVMNLSDASNVVVAKVTIGPRSVFPWHTHPGPVLITVVEGDFVYVLAEDCVERWYLAGSALIDAGFSNVHTAFNPSHTQETILIATFLGVPHGGPLTIPAEGPDAATCPLPIVQ